MGSSPSRHHAAILARARIGGDSQSRRGSQEAGNTMRTRIHNVLLSCNTYKHLRLLPLFAELNFVSALLSKHKLFGIYPLWDGPPCDALNSLNIIDKCIGKFESVSRSTIVGSAQGIFLIEYLQLIELSCSENSRNE